MAVQRRSRARAGHLLARRLPQAGGLSALLAVLAWSVAAGAQPAPWLGAGNKPERANCRTVVQDFGARADGDIGGTISRSLRPAFYGHPVQGLSLDQPLRAHGTFTAPQMDNGSVYLGWFDAVDKDRPASFLGLRLMAQGRAELYSDIKVVTGRWRTTGTNLDRKLDAGRGVHTFDLAYDPQGAQGAGEVTLRIDGAIQHWSLPAGLRRDGARFTHFGLSNTLWSPDATIDVRLKDLGFTAAAAQMASGAAAARAWEGRNNHVSFLDCETQKNNDFGPRPDGWNGGLFFRTDAGAPIYYASPTAPMGLDHPLKASGQVRFDFGMVDSGMLIGWFDRKGAGAQPPHGFVGLLVEGPSQEGFLFRAYVASRSGRSQQDRGGPVILQDGRVHPWSLVYDPAAAGGRGAVTVTLDGASRVLTLDEPLRRESADLDAFGMFPLRSGGGPMRIYFRNLDFTGR